MSNWNDLRHTRGVGAARVPSYLAKNAFEAGFRNRLSDGYRAHEF
jgi:hypothetical protein